MQQKFGFSKGMRQSISPNKADPDSYYEALNKRVVVDTKSGSAAITDEPGAGLLITIPATKGVYSIEGTTGTPSPSISFYTDLGTITVSIGIKTHIVIPGKYIYDTLMADADVQNLLAMGRFHLTLFDNKVIVTYLNDVVAGLGVSGTGLIVTTIVPPISDSAIIAMGSIREDLIIFTRSGEYGQIWKCRYNSAGGVGTLNANNNLAYNGHIYPDVSANYEIFDIIGRYDNSELVKIYWSNCVDNINHINIASKENLGLPPELLSISPDCSFEQAKVNSVVGGGLYYSGMVQYGYQLYNLNGAETVIAPLSGLIHLTESNNLASTSISYKGSENGKSVGKAVSITIDNLDYKFDFIKVIAVFYTSEEGEPEVNVVAESIIPESRSITIIDAGDTVLSVYTPAQLNSIGNKVFSAKLLTTKDNFLIAGNITDKYFDVDEELGTYWDARTYRFNGIGISRVKYEGGDYEDVSNIFTIDGESIPEQHDCHIDKVEQDTYKYINSGTKLGGTGPNIEYSFFVRSICIDDVSNPTKVITNPANNRQQWGTDNGHWDFIEDTYANNNSFTNYASPINQSEIVGYQRDELYRFGIVFFDGKGRQSFVKWVGDIKMPKHNDIDDVLTYYPDQDGKTGTAYNYSHYFNCSSTDYTYANALGVRFTVDTTALPTDWKFAIVRARREDIDKTILSQGAVTYLAKNTTYEFLNPLYDYKNFDAGYYDTRGYKGFVNFFSPEFKFGGNYERKDGDLIRFINTFTASGYGITPSGGQAGRFYKAGNPTLTAVTKYVEDGIKTDVTSTINYMVSSNGMDNRVSNYGWSIGFGEDDKKILYIGSNVLLGLTTDDVLGLTGQSIVNYERPLITQYGGFSYTAKQNTIYQLAGKLRPCGTNIESMVYGGDTFIEIFDFLYSILDSESNTGVPIAEAIKHKSVVMIPVETTINLALRHDTCPSKDYNAGVDARLNETIQKGLEVWPDGNPYGAYPSNLTDLYLYNRVYSKQPTGKTYVGKPFNFTMVQDRDCQVVSSEKSISGELVDSWTKFLFNNKITVNTANGALSKLLVFRNQVMFWQPKAFGQFSFNDRKVLKDENGTSLILGVGSVLEYYQYISEKSGTNFTRSVCDSGAAIYYYDDVNRKLMMTQGGHEESISDKADCAPLFKKVEFDYPTDVLSAFDKSTRRVLIPTIGDYVPEVPEVVETEVDYGLLYNFFAATNERNITSAGAFVVPSAAMWQTLREYVTELIGGGILKETGIIYWDTPNTGAINEVGFNARGSGLRSIELGFAGIKQIVFYITTTLEEGMPVIFEMFYNSEQLNMSNVSNDGVSIRLVRPATEAEQLLADGTACANYIGNDGKIYTTVKIGTQVWTAQNLCETQFRDGSYIHGFEGGVYTPISDVDWAVLTTDGVCAYNDNLEDAFTQTVVTPAIPAHYAGFTVGFNERLQAFESIYSYNPYIFMSHEGKLLGVKDDTSNTVYAHNDESIPNRFYGDSPAEGYIKIIAGNDVKKVFTNVEFNSVCANSTTEYPLVTVDNMKLENSYLESTKIPLTTSNLRRRFRTWRLQLPKTVEVPSGKSRYMDYYLGLTLYNRPTNNTNLRLEDVTFYYLIPML